MTTIENNKNKITLRMVVKYFIKKSRPYKWLILLSLLWSIIIAWISIISPIYQTKLVDIVSMTWVERPELVSMLLKILFIILVLELTNIWARRLVWFPMIKYENEATKDIYEECFQYLHKHSYRFFSNNLSWSLIRKISKLAWSYETVVDVFIFQILNMIIFIPMTIIIVMRENVKIWFMFLAFVIVYTILQIIFFNITKKYEIQANEWNSKTTWELSDSIINNFNVLIFASLPYEFKRFKETLVWWLNIRKKQRTLSERTYFASGMTTCTFGILSIYFAIKARWAWLVPASVIILVQLYVMRISNQLSNIRHILKALSRALWESTEMLEILNTPHEIQDNTNKKIKIWNGKIDFDNVTFSYIEWKKVFEWLNLNIKPWEKVAIVWASWSWKTTLIKLLFRFFDIQWWKILIDWQDISQVTQDSLREQLSMVPQDPILFHRTIKENIAYWRPNATDQEIIAAAKMAKCHDFIVGLKDWYESFVWERWIKLSWWERQRIAIARAILENKSILVMDEATSSLDSESEKYIQDAMDEVMRNKTCIVIAHRLSTIAKMDKIIVMDNWKIAEKWSHNILIQNKNWIYHKLWSIQSWGFLTSENL